MRVIIKESKEEVANFSANYIIKRINDFAPTKERPFVLGLPTGSSPLLTYKMLIEACKKGELSFEHVVTFNMDEYVGLDKKHPQSYHFFMHEHFFKHIDIKAENINILDGNTKDHIKECQKYEDKMCDLGGVELFLGGVGEDGHIAFNEPTSSIYSKTRIKTLDHQTRLANSRFFNSLDEVPKYALTVGIGTLLNAREVVILATGYNKALAIKNCVEDGINHLWPLSAMQLHERFMLVSDLEATSELKVKTLRYLLNVQSAIGINAPKIY
ncbi:MAG: glucosamine-6-phosphate deaminase [Helicobacter sp.]|nr:glucosamine-6-phosphate deaminase [Helicobacter sp.]